MTDADTLKRKAAAEAVLQVQDGMVLGLGSGSTAELFLAAVAERVRSGLKIVGVPTSKRVAELAHQHGLPITPLEDVTRIDLTVDGADEILPAGLDLIKGRGGALLREKLVAMASERLFIVADDSKLVKQIGELQPVPVAVIPFGWRQTAERLRALGSEPVLRLHDGAPFVSDDELYILDCHFGPIADPAALGSAIKAQAGVVEHGLFLGLAHRAIVASSTGITILEPETVIA
ncbi:MAG: ribose-5-phosphate isomerase RpiA [Chloroflexota bacterium]